MLRPIPSRTSATAFLITLALGCASKEIQSEQASVARAKGATGAGLQAPVPEPDLAPGFLIQLSSSQDHKLNGSFRIQADGKVDLPYNVSISTEGMSLADFRSEIATVYRPYFRNGVNVQVAIKQRRYYVEARGMVSHPGTYLVKRDSPLDEVVTLAGGLTDDLKSGFVRIDQSGRVRWVDLDDYYKRGNSADVPLWSGGERLFFQKERPVGAAGTAGGEMPRTVQLLGEVRNPGEFTYHRDADAYYYLGKAGGPTPASNLDRVELIRTSDDGKRERLTLGPVSRLGSLQSGDLLIVHPERQTGFERFLQTTSLVTGILTAALLATLAVQNQRR
jgi:protein involved in polysaccharide export with SLBB domain